MLNDYRMKRKLDKLLYKNFFKAKSQNSHMFKISPTICVNGEWGLIKTYAGCFSIYQLDSIELPSEAGPDICIMRFKTQHKIKEIHFTEYRYYRIALMEKLSKQKNQEYNAPKHWQLRYIQAIQKISSSFDDDLKEYCINTGLLPINVDSNTFSNESYINTQTHFNHLIDHTLKTESTIYRSTGIIYAIIVVIGLAISIFILKKLGIEGQPILDLLNKLKDLYGN